MTLNDLVNYRTSLGDNLMKLEVKMEADTETTNDTLYVMQTKETYVYEDEQDADDKIEEARQDNGFKGVTKKFKEAKYSKKTQEEITPATYTVVVTLAH